jgi:biopolymer transport protein ExbB/TolQ/biopolymer transport protein ExbD
LPYLPLSQTYSDS